MFVGAGIMSATLAVLLKELQPDLKMEVFESLDAIAEESSNAWNNAGTGHAALCELNYTPEQPDGSIETKKALEINEAFEVSKQLWSYLVEQGTLEEPGQFIQAVPHLSFVHGEKNVSYLRRRFEALREHPLFEGMEYSEEPAELAEWMPLVIAGRDPNEPVAGTRVTTGTDVNFGALTRQLLASLGAHDDVTVHLSHEVKGLKRRKDGLWRVTVKDRATGAKKVVDAKFVFLGAGGGALPLLQKSGIPEGKGFGGFPVSGQWLRCDNPALVEKHHAKVYGRASVGAPPMSVPHLDTRVIDGQRSLLFGPFAGFNTKFLKNGSLLDLPLSVRPDNLVAMLAAGRDNIDLTKYLIGQVLQSPEERLEALREYLPEARAEDWDLEIAGQRVQIIKKDAKRGGVLQFGTEVVSAEDGSLAALLGASPGASTSVSIMLELLGRCFSEEMQSEAWQTKLKEMIPSYGEDLSEDSELLRRMRTWTGETLDLEERLFAVV